MKKKAGTLLYGLTPMFAYYAAQIAAVFGVSFGTSILIGTMGLVGEKNSMILSLLEKEYVYICSVLAVILFLIPGYFWYRNIQKRMKERKYQRIRFGTSSVIILFFLALASQFAVDMILDILYAIVPGIFQNYFEVMDQLGMSKPTVFSVIYVVIAAPAAEELVFRGITLGILRKEFPFWAANLLQALFFGIFHMNLIQGVYAFLFGMVFGFTLRRYGTLKATVLTHFFVNLSGQILGLVSTNILTETGGFLFCAGIFAILFSREQRKRRTL